MDTMNLINKNIKKLIILLFISNFAFCQDIEHIRKLDTIYISFTKKEGLEKNVYTDNYRDYRFYLKTKENEKTEYLLFEKPDRKNSLTEKGHPRIDTRIENKTFLKKHKEDIIDIDFFKKYDREFIACEIFGGFKTLYIIDFTEKKSKIVLYTVFSMNHCPIYE